MPFCGPFSRPMLRPLPHWNQAFKQAMLSPSREEPTVSKPPWLPRFRVQRTTRSRGTSIRQRPVLAGGTPARAECPVQGSGPRKVRTSGFPGSRCRHSGRLRRMLALVTAGKVCRWVCFQGQEAGSEHFRPLRQAARAITSTPTRVSPNVDGSGNCWAVPNSTPS